MTIGEKQSVICYDGITRTGRIVYIHPDNLYRVLEFTGRIGSWREAILTARANADAKAARSRYHDRTAYRRRKKGGAK